MGRFRATDPERDSFVWSVEGADGVFFSIDDRGYLSFNDPPDFEVKADANGDNVYEPVIVATDIERNAGRLIAKVTVTDANEPPTVSGRTAVSVNENDENFGETYTGTDPEDPSADITRWSLTGRDAGDFRINEERPADLPERTGPREAGGLEQGQRVPGDGEGVGREVLRDAGRGGDGE